MTLQVPAPTSVSHHPTDRLLSYPLTNFRSPQSVPLLTGVLFESRDPRSQIQPFPNGQRRAGVGFVLTNRASPPTARPHNASNLLPSAPPFLGSFCKITDSTRNTIKRCVKPDHRNVGFVLQITHSSRPDTHTMRQNAFSSPCHAGQSDDAATPRLVLDTGSIRRG